MAFHGYYGDLATYISWGNLVNQHLSTHLHRDLGDGQRERRLWRGGGGNGGSGVEA